MKCPENTLKSTIAFFRRQKTAERTKDRLNSAVQAVSGISSFFRTEPEIAAFYKELEKIQPFGESHKNAGHGDFQTPLPLAMKICKLLKKKKIEPKVLLEPTCGKGSFLLAALNVFQNLKKIYAVEINEAYIWQSKLSILSYFLENSKQKPPKIHFFAASIFDFNLKTKILPVPGEILILGNPPWVTNSALSVLKSGNVPPKTNRKKHSGIEAITGKGNFDIAEFIATTLLDNLAERSGNLALLLKKSVIKNLVYEQKHQKRPISEIQNHAIDAKKEFDAQIGAGLFFVRLKAQPELVCTEYEFYTQKQTAHWGWTESKFVANIAKYQKNKHIDGNSPFLWRQGIKHDAAPVMELVHKNAYFLNKQGEKATLEDELVYGLLKSSDLNGKKTAQVRKYTLVPQKNVGEETAYIQKKYPKIFSYLSKNKQFFAKRKSAIYKGKPEFSIFGIGDYSFLPFKVAISGMYKNTKFSLVLPQNNKPVMLDDTCYFIGFQNESEAKITQFLLNKPQTQDFIQSVAFDYAKRKITKALLMRIDLCAVAKHTDFEELHPFLPEIKKETWQNYVKKISPPTKAKTEKKTFLRNK